MISFQEAKDYEAGFVNPEAILCGRRKKGSGMFPSRSVYGELITEDFPYLLDREKSLPVENWTEERENEF